MLCSNRTLGFGFVLLFQDAAEVADGEPDWESHSIQDLREKDVPRRYRSDKKKSPATLQQRTERRFRFIQAGLKVNRLLMLTV